MATALINTWSSLTLKDNKLFIEPNEWLIPISEGYSELEKSYLWVVTNKKANSKELEKALLPIMDLEGPVGLEPTTRGLKGHCSNQLSYGPGCYRAG